MTGLFVSFEGGEGAGKSTQVTLLALALRKLGHDVITTREPGATAIGARLRELLLDPESKALRPRAEALLYAADRAQHVEEIVRPALHSGSVVITDRYVDSSLAYQGGGRELTTSDIAALSTFATAGLAADVTVLLDIDPRIGLDRAGRSAAPDRLEAEQIEFHDRVRERFLALAAAGGDRYLVVDASGSSEGVAQRIIEFVTVRIR